MLLCYLPFSGILPCREAERLAEIKRDEQRQALEREANELREREQQEAEKRERERLVYHLRNSVKLN